MATKGTRTNRPKQLFVPNHVHIPVLLDEFGLEIILFLNKNKAPTEMKALDKLKMSTRALLLRTNRLTALGFITSFWTMKNVKGQLSRRKCLELTDNGKVLAKIFKDYSSKEVFNIK